MDLYKKTHNNKTHICNHIITIAPIFKLIYNVFPSFLNVPIPKFKAKTKFKTKDNNNRQQKKYKGYYWTIFIFFVVLILSYFIYNIYNKFQINTDNAYLITENTEIISKLNKKIKHVYIENERHVVAGEILLELDNQEYTDNIMAIKASLLLAEQYLKSAKENHQQSSILFAANRINAQQHEISFKELQIAIAKHQHCQKLLNNAEEQLKNTKIYATKDGWVTNLHLTANQEIKENQKILEIISDKNFWIMAHLSAKKLKYIKLDQKVKIQITNSENLKTYKFFGKVKKIVYLNKLQYKVKILITNNDFYLPLRNGMKAHITIYTNPFVKPTSIGNHK